MKKQVVLLSLVALMVAGMSCSEKEDIVDNNSGGTPVQFASQVSSLRTSTSGNVTSWTSGDKVGIYMIKTGQSLGSSSILNGAENRQYSAAASGLATTFTPASNQTIYYPEGIAVDFVAYYPYKASIPLYAYPVDVNDQSNQSLLDVLLVKKTNVTKGDEAVALQFEHQLTKFIIHVKKGAGMESANLSAMTAKFSGLPATASLALTDGTLTPAGNTSPVNALKVATGSGDDATFEATLIPTSSTSGGSILFAIEGNNHILNELPASFDKGKQYSYTVTIGRNAVSFEATIGEWIPIEGEGTATLLLPTIKLQSPADGVSIDASTTTFPIAFSWDKEASVAAYTLKISASSGNFTESPVYVSGDLGDVATFSLSESNYDLALDALGLTLGATNTLYWTVVPTNETAEVLSEVRSFTATRAGTTLNATTIGSFDLGENPGITLKQGQKIRITGIPGIESWWIDPDFFTKVDDNTFIFKSMDGTYQIFADAGKTYFKVSAVSGGSYATLQENGSGAVWVSGWGVGKPAYASGWDPNFANACCMAKISDKVYQVTIEVGTTIHPTGFFELYKSPTWGAAWHLRASQISLNDQSAGSFVIDDSVDAEMNGGISGGIVGVTYLFTLDLTAGNDNAVLTITEK